MSYDHIQIRYSFFFCYIPWKYLFCLQDDVEAQMRRLRLELKQTMDMYSSACKEALTARQEVLYYRED